MHNSFLFTSDPDLLQFLDGIGSTHRKELMSLHLTGLQTPQPLLTRLDAQTWKCFPETNQLLR